MYPEHGWIFAKVKIAKAMDASFANSQTDDERKIAELIRQFNAEQTTKLEMDLFKQRKRLADALRTLQTKEMKRAREDERISTDKIAWTLGKLSDIRRTELVTRTRASSPVGTRP